VNDNAHNQLLVFRFSAMGDVAMTVPVIRLLLDQHPQLTITFVSDEKFKPLFGGISRLEFFGADIHNDYIGITGLFRLYRRLRTEKHFSAIADLHDVLRTKVLSFFFRISGYKVRKINKGRSEKKALTRKKNKRLAQLKTSFQRYAEVFGKLGYPLKLATSQNKVKLLYTDVVMQLLGENSNFRVGLAPFAKHKEKTYPLEKMEKVIEALTKKGHRIFLFGGGVDEINTLERWEDLYPGTLNLAGELPLEEELMLISHLDLMISMDSANMHLASLYGVSVVSIWGATHPFAGFYGYGQSPENIVQVDLSCRPCSVFGNKKCFRGDWACMQLISPELVIEKVEKVLYNQKGEIYN
jgi:ADP-heptose:LPS heptosyltransferase